MAQAIITITFDLRNKRIQYGDNRGETFHDHLMRCEGRTPVPSEYWDRLPKYFLCHDCKSIKNHLGKQLAKRLTPAYLRRLARNG